MRNVWRFTVILLAPVVVAGGGPTHRVLRSVHDRITPRLVTTAALQSTAASPDLPKEVAEKLRQAMTEEAARQLRRGQCGHAVEGDIESEPGLVGVPPLRELVKRQPIALLVSLDATEAAWNVSPPAVHTLVTARVVSVYHDVTESFRTGDQVFFDEPGGRISIDGATVCTENTPYERRERGQRLVVMGQPDPANPHTLMTFSELLYPVRNGTAFAPPTVTTRGSRDIRLTELAKVQRQ
jgi:hypothetical protein